MATKWVKLFYDDNTTRLAERRNQFNSAPQDGVVCAIIIDDQDDTLNGILSLADFYFWPPGDETVYHTNDIIPVLERWVTEIDTTPPITSLKWHQIEQQMRDLDIGWIKFGRWVPNAQFEQIMETAASDDLITAFGPRRRFDDPQVDDRKYRDPDV